MKPGTAPTRHLVQFVFGVLCVLLTLGHTMRYAELPVLASLDTYLYDIKLRLTMPNTLDNRVVIVDIDEKSLAEVGHWPWGRHVVAKLVHNLVDDYKVATIGFDIVFAEPDNSSGLAVLEDLGRQQLSGVPAYRQALSALRSSLDYDSLLAETLKNRPVVLGFYFSNDKNAQIGGALPEPAFPAGFFSRETLPVFSWQGYGGNIPLLQSAVSDAGHFNPVVDPDGISRRVPLIVEFGGAYYQSLSLAVLRKYLGDAGLMPIIPEGGSDVEALEVITDKGSLSIPVDEHLSALIPYRGGKGSFRYIPAVDVLEGRISKDELVGSIVLLGTTAPGLMDLRATPVASVYPGVEMHANLIAGMLDGTIKESPLSVIVVESLMVLLFGALLTVLLPLVSPLRAALLMIVTLALTLSIDLWLWQSLNIVMPVAGCLVMIVLIFAFDMSWGYLVETRTKRQFTDLFGQYVPPELVEEMARNPENYSMEGQNKELTVLFSDVRSFTTLSEGMDPKELSALMNEYLGAMTAIIRAQRGTLDKYIGDAIMAFWGAPVADAEHARRAVMAALAMQQGMRGLDEPFALRGWPKLHIGVGINTGVMTVGDMGSPVRKAYTVMGDAVNLASRLEGITKEYGVGIVVGEATCRLLPDVAFRELDRVRVKGKEKGVSIFEPLGLLAELPAETKETLVRWQQFLEYYREQAWDKADQLLTDLRGQSPESHLYKLYAERLAFLREHPPGDNWDGVTIFKTK